MRILLIMNQLDSCEIAHVHITHTKSCKSLLMPRGASHRSWILFAKYRDILHHVSCWIPDIPARAYRQLSFYFSPTDCCTVWSKSGRTISCSLFSQCPHGSLWSFSLRVASPARYFLSWCRQIVKRSLAVCKVRRKVKLSVWRADSASSSTLSGFRVLWVWTELRFDRAQKAVYILLRASVQALPCQG